MTEFEKHMTEICNGIAFEIYEYSQIKSSINGTKIFPIINVSIRRYKDRQRFLTLGNIVIETLLNNKVYIFGDNGPIIIK